MIERPRQIEQPDLALYPTFYLASDTPGVEVEVQAPRKLNVELRGNEFWVEPDDVCGVHYVFPFDELEAMVAAHALDEAKPPKPERAALLEAKNEAEARAADAEAAAEQAEVRQGLAEIRRDDSERRIVAVLTWAKENGHEDELAEILAGIVTAD